MARASGHIFFFRLSVDGGSKIAMQVKPSTIFLQRVSESGRQYIQLNGNRYLNVHTIYTVKTGSIFPAKLELLGLTFTDKSQLLNKSKKSFLDLNFKEKFLVYSKLRTCNSIRGFVRPLVRRYVGP